MPNFLVTWMIDIEDAENAEDAARHAHDAYTRDGSIAHVFDVQQVTEAGSKGKPIGDVEVIDLDELDGNPEA